MSTIKNGHLLLYCHFTKTIKKPVTSFQSPSLNQEHNGNVYDTVYQYCRNFISIVFKIQKEYALVTSIMKQCLMTSQILTSVDFTKTKKSKYIENKGNIVFYASMSTLLRKIVLQRRLPLRPEIGSRILKISFEHYVFTPSIK